MNTTTAHNFAQLITAWNSHEALRHSGASVADLATSRWSLDERRAALR